MPDQPGRSDGRAGAGRRSTAVAGFAAADAVGVLSLYLVVQIALPSRLIVGTLGGAGTPAQLVGMALAAGCLLRRASFGLDRERRIPAVGVAMLVFAAAVLLSYIAAMTRPIVSDERRSADLGLLILLSWAGVLFTAMDAVPSRARLDVLMRRFVALAGALAGFGLVQYVTGRPWTEYIQVPGLVRNNTLESVYDRDGFVRPAGTALHPIEFGSVLTMALPFALHYALTDRSGPAARSPLRRWFPVAAIAFAVPLSISRSALVSAVVVLVLVVPTWARPVRRRAYAVLAALGAVLYVVVPGLLGTLTGLFTGISSDASAQSRTGSYAIAERFIERAPWTGRGFLTFLPSYRILDNQYLGVLIELGFVGLFALLALFGTGIVTSNRLARRTLVGRDRGLAHAFTASIASAGVSLALFDAFSFPMAAGLMFFVLGTAAAARRLASTSSRPPGSRPRPTRAPIAAPAAVSS